MPTANHPSTQSMAPTTDSRTVNIVSYLQDLTLSSPPSALRYPPPEGSATVEEKALAWILDTDPAQLGVETEEDQHRLVQRYALATFWFIQATVQWPWKEDARAGWMTAAHECDWNMIRCQDQTYSKNDGTLFTSLTVHRIDASAKNIRGQLPNDLGLLSNIKSLDFRFDKLTGTIPTQFGQLNQLTYLNFFDNDLSGSIPDEISGLSNLRLLDFRNSQLNGAIPTQFGQLNQLTFLNFGSNDLSGPIPHELSGLPNMRVLDFSYNHLNGTIPTQFGELNQLTYLSLGYNDLSGPIPVEMASLSNIKSLDFERNQLNGTIPKDFGQLNQLTSLDFSDNDLSGPIPNEISNLTRLISLYFDQNPRLEGTIPSSLASLPCLDNLHVYLTNLTGEMPLCGAVGRTYFAVIADCDSVECPCCIYCCPAFGDIPASSWLPPECGVV